MEKVSLAGFMIVPLSELTAIQAELDSHIALTLAEHGCKVFKVTQNKRNPCRFDVYEEFVDPEAFLAHQVRVKSSRWGELTVNVERHYTLNGID